MKVFTTEQSQLLSQLIDENWEANNTSNSYQIRDWYRVQATITRIKLISIMGQGASSYI